MINIDIHTVLLSFLIINITSTLMVGLLYSQVKKRYPKSFLILLSFIISSSGFLLLFLRNILPEWISLVIGNTLIVSSAVILLIGLEQFINKKGIQIQNYLLIIIYLLFQIYFTYFEPDVTMRRLILSTSYLFISFQIAWLMFRRTPLKIRKITRLVGRVSCFIFLINIVRIIFIVFKQEKATDFLRLGNYEAFFLIFSQVYFIMLAYSISLMYNKKLIIEVKEKERNITILAAEKYQQELNFKNKELSQNSLYLASLKEGNKNILTELKKDSGSFTKTGNYNFHELKKKFKKFFAGSKNLGRV